MTFRYTRRNSKTGHYCKIWLRPPFYKRATNILIVIVYFHEIKTVLVGPFLAFRNQSSKLVCKCVKLTIIGMQNSKLLKSSQQRNDIEVRTAEFLESNATCFEFNIFWKRTVTGEMKITESKMLDSAIASFIYEKALSSNVTDSPSFAAVFNQCIQSSM